MNRIRISATVALLAVSLVACGSDSKTADSSGEASSDTISPEAVAPFGEGEVAELRMLMASFGAPVEETKCVAEELAGKIDKVELKKMLDAAENADAEADTDLETLQLFNEAVNACGLS